jgi:hypothetical protein
MRRLNSCLHGHGVLYRSRCSPVFIYPPASTAVTTQGQKVRVSSVGLDRRTRADQLTGWVKSSLLTKNPIGACLLPSIVSLLGCYPRPRARQEEGDGDQPRGGRIVPCIFSRPGFASWRVNASSRIPVRVYLHGLDRPFPFNLFRSMRRWHWSPAHVAGGEVLSRHLIMRQRESWILVVVL